MAQTVTLWSALVAGMLSFFTPCVLPMVPVYLSYVASSAAGSEDRSRRGRTFLRALAFVSGFGLVFVTLGVAAGMLGGLLRSVVPLLVRIGGLLLMMLGFHTTGLVPIRFLNAERHVRRRPGGEDKWWSSLLIGVIFAAGWSPCVGPILSGILLMAANGKTAGIGATLLLVYVAGFGIPFLVVAGLMDAAVPWFARVARHMRALSVFSGALLIVMGFLLLSGLL